MNSGPGNQNEYVDYERALRLIPSLVESGRLAVAKRWTYDVMSSRPTDPRGWNQMALINAKAEDYGGARELLTIAILLAPGSAELLVNRGNISRMLNAHEDALRLFKRAGYCRPDDPEVAVAIALQLLTLGDYDAGFAAYERRWSRRTAFAELARAGIRAWDDQAEPIKSLVCVVEQGAGDSVQFIRYATNLKRAGLEVIVYCTKPLARLLSGARDVDRVVVGVRAGSYDTAEMVMSLPFRMGTSLENIPSRGRYIDPPAHPYRIAGETGRPKVGLCWAGNPNHKRDAQRSCPYATFASFLDVPGIDFFSLQVGEAAQQCVDDDRITDLSEHIDDFADTAGLIDQLDLVITVDSAVAHLAGALGKPCWVLLHWVADWRWGQTATETAWYPGMRLHRRRFLEPWHSAIPRICEALVMWRDRRDVESDVPD